MFKKLRKSGHRLIDTIGAIKMSRICHLQSETVKRGRRFGKRKIGSPLSELFSSMKQGEDFLKIWLFLSCEFLFQLNKICDE